MKMPGKLTVVYSSLIIGLILLSGCFEPAPLCSEKERGGIELRPNFTKEKIQTAIEKADLSEGLKNTFMKESEKIHQRFITGLEGGVIDENFFCELSAHIEKKEKHVIMIGNSKEDFEAFLNALVEDFGLEEMEEHYNHELRHTEKAKALGHTPFFGVEIMIYSDSTDGYFVPFTGVEPSMVKPGH